ncbi:MAG: hypothetical protein J6X18_15410 [Bacteroidales bacterium]|nr:hypothetical protein [Bacteroidales bacterium]
MTPKEIKKKFLINTEDTGRFIVKSLKTGKTYYIEPIDDGERLDWGDINPATKKIEGDYGTKYKGGVKPSESLITEENGFENIVTLGHGYSPLAYIEQLEKDF